MLKIDERFNISKDSRDIGNVKIMLYNFEIEKEYHNSKLYITDTDGSTVKIIDSLWLDKDAVFFQLDNTIEKGEYFYNISLNTQYESIDIIYDRRLSVL